MEIRSVKDSDFPTLASWFERRKWPMPARDGVFPKVGFIAVSDEELLACAFLYTTGSAVAFLEWTCVSPECTSQLGQLALTRIIDHVKSEVGPKASPPITVLRSYAVSEKFAHKLERVGFKSGGAVEQMTWVAQG